MKGLKVGLAVGLMTLMASPAFARSIDFKGAGTALWIFLIIGAIIVLLQLIRQPFSSQLHRNHHRSSPEEREES